MERAEAVSDRDVRVALTDAHLLVCDERRQLSHRRREMMVRELCMLEYKTLARAHAHCSLNNT